MTSSRNKPSKAGLTKYKNLLQHHLATLRGDVGSMRDEALRASEQDASVDHLADQGTDNYDQGFMLGLMADGWSMEQILDSYPRVTREDVLAAIAFVTEVFREEDFVAIQKATV